MEKSYFKEEKSRRNLPYRNRDSQMTKLKKYEARCIICEKVYTLNSGYSHQFCHVICLNQDRRNKIKERRELKNSSHPIPCKCCNEMFVKIFFAEKYCSEMCREKLYAEKRAEDRENQPKKKKFTTQQIGQWIEQKRVKKSNGVSLKQYNSVRG